MKLSSNTPVAQKKMEYFDAGIQWTQSIWSPSFLPKHSKYTIIYKTLVIVPTLLMLIPDIFFGNFVRLTIGNIGVATYNKYCFTPPPEKKASNLPKILKTSAKVLVAISIIYFSGAKLGYFPPVSSITNKVRDLFRRAICLTTHYQCQQPPNNGNPNGTGKPTTPPPTTSWGEWFNKKAEFIGITNPTSFIVNSVFLPITLGIGLFLSHVNKNMPTT
jgi:hypothetical protein